MANEDASCRARARSLRAGDDAARADPGERRRRQVLGHGLDLEDAVALAVVRAVGDAAGDRALQRVARDRLAVHAHGARGRERRCRRPRAAASAHRMPIWPARPRISPCRTERLTGSTSPGASRPSTSRRTSPNDAARGGNIASSGPPEHALDQAVDRQLGDGDRVAALAVAEDRRAVADVEHLAQAVRHVDHALARVGQRADDAVHARDLDVGERRRRLVEDEDARLAGQQPRDLDELALGHRERRDVRARVQVAEPYLGQVGPRPLGHPPARPEAAEAPAEEDVLAGRERRHEAQLLLHHRDAGGRGSGGRWRGRRAGRRSRSCPSSGSTRPERIFTSVDLPAPFSPSRAMTSPRRSSNETSSSARTGP